jgi:hypothetical protein
LRVAAELREFNLHASAGVHAPAISALSIPRLSIIEQAPTI